MICNILLQFQIENWLWYTLYIVLKRALAQGPWVIKYLGSGILLYCSCLFHSHTCWFASLFPSTFVVCQQARCKCLLNSWGWPLVTSIFTNYQQIVHNAGNGLLWIIASRQVLSISMTIEIFYFVLIYQTMFYHKVCVCVYFKRLK